MVNATVHLDSKAHNVKINATMDSLDYRALKNATVLRVILIDVTQQRENVFVKRNGEVSIYLNLLCS